MKVSSKNRHSFKETIEHDMRKQKNEKRPLSDPILGTRKSFSLPLAVGRMAFLRQVVPGPVKISKSWSEELLFSLKQY